MEVSYFSVIGALEGHVYCHSGGQVIFRRGRVASLEMMFYFFSAKLLGFGFIFWFLSYTGGLIFLEIQIKGAG